VGPEGLENNSDPVSLDWMIVNLFFFFYRYLVFFFSPIR
jgi:hypothetical protein